MLEVEIKALLGAFSLDVAFAAPAGVTAIFGPSGSGKTSLINALSGILQPDEGRIFVDGTVLFDSKSAHNTPIHKRRVGYVFQDARLFPHLSVAQNLTYGGAFKFDEVIGLLGLDNLLDRSPRTLSGGEAQRVAIGRALLSNPQILLLDEPLAALDAPRKADVLPYLEALRDTLQIPMVYVTHAIGEVARMATTLVIIEGGRVRCVGPVAEVLTDPATVPLIGVQDAGAILRAKVIDHDVDGGTTRLKIDGGEVFLPGAVGQLGQEVRLRVAASDVVLMTEKPLGISALNLLAAQISSITEDASGAVIVRLAVGPNPILARITRKSARALELVEGKAVWAILKAHAVAP